MNEQNANQENASNSSSNSHPQVSLDSPPSPNSGERLGHSGDVGQAFDPEPPPKAEETMRPPEPFPAPPDEGKKPGHAQTKIVLTSGGRDEWQPEKRKEIMAAIKDCVAQLGYVPTAREFRRMTGISMRRIQSCLVSYAKALKACGFVRHGAGYETDPMQQFLEWAAAVRRLGAVPTGSEFDEHSKISRKSFQRCYGPWSKVPEAMLRYATQHGLEGAWMDVVEIARNHCEGKSGTGRASSTPLRPTLEPQITLDRHLYGASLIPLPMAQAPVNEWGVVLMFGALAVRLGFTILWIGPQFPDGHAVREVKPGRCQLVKLEFEFQSYNFVLHRHDLSNADVIVCWEHNWPECPIEVVELKKVVAAMFPTFAINKTQNL